MYEFFLFDLDGTLLDTLDDLHAATNAALTAFGLPKRTKEEVRSFVGNGIRKLIERAVGKPDRRFEEILQCFKRYYGEHCEDETQPYEGVIDLLKAIKERGGKCAVVSNKADFAVKKLAKTYFGELVYVAIGENEEAGVKKKPAPDSVFAAMKALNADPKRTVYIGDSEVDIQTAKNAGLSCVSVTWGFKDEEFLKANGATTIVRTPNEILKF